MSETQGVIKKNSTINPNRENLSSVKNLSHNICDCGTSVFTRELLLLVCASPYHAARGRQHPVQWEQHLVILCSQEGRLVVFCEAVCCENRRYLQSYLWSVSICIVPSPWRNVFMSVCPWPFGCLLSHLTGGTGIAKASWPLH